MTFLLTPSSQMNYGILTHTYTHTQHPDARSMINYCNVGCQTPFLSDIYFIMTGENQKQILDFNQSFS